MIASESCGTKENALHLITEVAADPAAAFDAALSKEDPVALAIVSILAPGTDAGVAGARLRAFVAKYADDVSAELLISLAGSSDGPVQVGEELGEAGESVLRELRDASRPLSLAGLQAERVKTLIADRDLPSPRRALFLWWLNESEPKLGDSVALSILADPDEPFEHQVQRAAIVIGSHADFKVREAR